MSKDIIITVKNMESFIYSLLLLPQLTLADYKKYEVTAFDAHERSILYKIHYKEKYAYFMNDVTNEAIIPMDILVDECCTQSFEKKLTKNNIQFLQVSEDSSYVLWKFDLRLVIINNLNNDRSHVNRLDINRQNYSSTSTVRFYNWNKINTWVSKHVKEHAELKKIVIAKTYENRDLFILKLSTGKRRVAVFIMGGENARDWLTPAIILNLIKKLLEKEDLKLLTDYYDFYFLPFMNPDGYVYSRNMNQFWAKNRKKFIPHIKCSGNYSAEGVNLERNWYFTKSTYNAIDQECNAVYSGQRPLSEEETQALSYALNNLAIGLMAFINLKGFNRLITIPYGNEEVSINHDITMELITMASVTLKEKYNVTYYVGSTAKYIYNSSGNVADWVKKMLNIPIVYTVHLKHKDDVLPKFQNIEPLTQQLDTILKETLTMAKDIYGPLFSTSSKLKVSYVMGAYYKNYIFTEFLYLTFCFIIFIIY